MIQPTSKAQIKHIRQLQLKKYRQRYEQFVVEGTKSVLEFVQSSYKCLGIYATTDWLEEFSNQIQEFNASSLSQKELEQVSNLKNAQKVIAVFEMPTDFKLDETNLLILGLEDIRDPGNLGTIIRTADWFGHTQILCSHSCADCFNPKVIQASMGSMSRIKIIYADILDYLQKNEERQLVVADLDGDNFKHFEWKGKNLLIIGNEGKGVSEEILLQQPKKITIPKVGKAESLNAAMSAGIILASV